LKTSQPVDLPRASLRKKRGIWVIWAVPVIAALVAGGLILTNIREAGPLITIIFNDGNGLQANQTIIKYRGTRVGEVRSVQLTADLQQVVVQVRLQRSAAALAQAGSQFWIVRPEVSSGGLHGLETIVSGPYIQAQPGQGEPQKRFIGSAEPPVDMNPGGRFEVMVTTPQINTLSIGSPVYYRGVEVGSVSYFVLDDDARLIRIHLLIGTNFAPLVRLNSKFWNAGGINVRLKFIGVDLSAENLKSLIIGGIAFATPDGPGSPAPAGTLFTLFEKPNKEWLDWSPSIAIPNSKNGNNDASPPPALLNKLNPAD
jgi:paraquat-inducible protein B